MISTLPRPASAGVRDLHPRGPCAWQNISNKDLRVSSIKSASPQMNHHRQALGSGCANHLADVAALRRISDVDRRRHKVQLEADQLPASSPMLDLVDCGILQRIHRQKSNKPRWIL